MVIGLESVGGAVDAECVAGTSASSVQAAMVCPAIVSAIDSTLMINSRAGQDERLLFCKEGLAPMQEGGEFVSFEPVPRIPKPPRNMTYSLQYFPYILFRTV